MRVTFRDIVRTAGFFSRRELRKRRMVGLFDGAEVADDDAVKLDSTWRPVVLGHRTAHARAGLPPVYALFKPTGYEVSHAPTAHPSALSLVPTDLRPAATLAVGRLDVDTEGLLLIASDGALVHGLTHPRRRVERTYLVGTRSALEDAVVERVLAGDVELRDGHRPRPVAFGASGAPDGHSDALAWTRVTLTEGRYHEVRRLFAAIEAPLLRLHRASYGPVSLSQLQLSPAGGAWLADDVVAALYDAASLPRPEPELCVSLSAPGTGEGS